MIHFAFHDAAGDPSNTDLELSFDLRQLLRLDGLEGSGTQKIDPKAIRSAYIEEIEHHNRALAVHARTLSIDYVVLQTDRGLDVALTAYLARRKAR